MNEPETHPEAPIDLAELRATIPTEFEQCTYCGRKFFLGRLKMHHKLCTPLKPLIRKNHHESSQNDISQNPHRPKSTSLKKPKNTTIFTHSQDQKKIAKWRIEHQAVLQNFRKGTNENNPLVYNYIECPYCQRKFAPNIAEQHIPKCQNILHRPSPPGLKQNNLSAEKLNISSQNQKTPVPIKPKYEESVKCKYCQRQFNHRLIDNHIQICKKFYQKEQEKIMKSKRSPSRQIEQSQNLNKKVITLEAPIKQQYIYTQIIRELLCKQCQYQMSEEHNFCGRCGAKK